MATDRVIQPNGANIANFVGMINIRQCEVGVFATTAEGVYSCRTLNSSKMYETMKLGVYYNERSKLYIIDIV